MLIGVVPARGGSRGVLRKNLLEVGGVPMFVRAARTLQEVCDIVFVSTDDREITQVANAHGIPVIEQAHTDTTTVDWVLADIWDKLPVPPDDAEIIMLQPTMVHVDVATVADFMVGVTDGDMAAAVAVVQSGHLMRDFRGKPMYVSRKNRQNSRIYREVGLRYVSGFAKDVDWMKAETVHIDGAKALDVDTPEDYAAAIHPRGLVIFEPLMRRTNGAGHLHRTLSLAERLQHHEVVFIADGASNREMLARIPWKHERRASMLGVLKNNAMGTGRLSIVWVRDALGSTRQEVAEIYAARGDAEVLTLEDSGPGAAYATRSIDPLHDPGGARWTVLRPEFLDLPQDPIRETIERVLITFGGTDYKGYSTPVAQIAHKALPAAEIRIVSPPAGHLADPNVDGVSVLHDPSMALEMRLADLVITSGGRTVFEAAATGTPTIAIPTNAQEMGHRHLGQEHGNIVLRNSLDELPPILQGLSRVDRIAMADVSRRKVDGRGAGRIARLIEGMML